MGKIEDVSILLGKIITKIMVAGDKEIHFWTNENEHYQMYHDQMCCESVLIEDIVGDLNNLIGSPLTMSEVVTEYGTNDDAEDWNDSYTWSFYKFATVKGYVTIRWYGVSNGYYSEEVDFERTDESFKIPQWTKIDIYS